MRKNMKTAIKRYLSKIEPYWNFIYLLIVVCFAIIVFIWANTYLNFINLYLTQSPLLSNLLFVVIAIILIYYTYKVSIRLEYFHALKAIILEMKHNYDEMGKFQSNLIEAYVDCDNVSIKRWIAKSPSLTNWGNGENFHYKYLPSQAYFNFINKGYINQNENLELPVEPIANFYQFCIEFSNDLQELENLFRRLESGKDKAPVKIKLTRFNEKEFQSANEICKFFIEEFYPFYANKNPFNEGIIKEYKKTIKSLKEHRWLITDEILLGLLDF